MILKLLHANPFLKSKVESQAKELGVSTDKIIENIDPDMAARVKSVEEANSLIDNAKVKTEVQLKADRENTIKSEIVSRQIQANYKEGKPVEEIIKLEQIPKEYLPHVAEEINGVLTVKPEMIERVRSNLQDQKNIILTDIESPVNRYNQVKSKWDEAIDKLDTTDRNTLKQQHIDDYFKKMGERNFTNLPNTRRVMDNTIDSVINSNTPVQMVKMLENHGMINDVVSKTGFKPNIQKVLTSELTNALIQKTNYIPSVIKSQAERYADSMVKKFSNELKSTIKSTQKEIEQLQTDPISGKAIEVDHYQNMTDVDKQSFLGDEITNINKDYDVKIAESKAYYQPALQKIFGTSAEYGERAIDAKEYGSHYTNLMDWYRTPTDKLMQTFEKSGYLDMKVNAKMGLSNKSRVIQQRIGEDVYRKFADPIRTAKWTATKELSLTKDRLNELKEGLKPKEREDIEAYQLGQQSDAIATLEKMGVKVPKWEELSAKQQAVINEFNRINKQIFDRVNTARQLAGLKPLSEVKNYSTFIRKFTMLEKLGFDPCRVKSSVFDDVSIEDIRTKALAFSFGKDRVNSTRNFEMDSFVVMDKYLTQAINTIHMTPVIGKLRTALESEKLMLTNPNAHQYLNMTLDFVSGKKISEAKEITNYLANVAHRNLTAATLAANAHTIIVQPSSALIAGYEIGPKYLAIGTKDVFNESLRKFAMKESKVLLTRTYDASIDEVRKGVTGNITALQAKGIEIGNIPTKYADLFAAEVTWLGGYRYAKDTLNLNHKGCVNYADDLVIRTQGSAERIDLAPIQHTPLGKLATTFQTFAINQFGFLKDDVLGFANNNKLIAEGVSKKEMFKYDSSSYIKKPTGKNTFNIYETKRLKTTPDMLKSAAKMAVVLGVINTIYELIGESMPEKAGKIIGTTPPGAAPVSAFYEKMYGQSWVDTLYGKTPTTQNVKLIDGFLESLKESATIFPIWGGAAKYGGGNVGGAFGSLVIDTFDLISNQPSAKPWGYILAKWAGVPGTTQTYKILKQLQKERMAEHKNVNTNPIKEAKKELYPSDENPINKAKRELWGHPRYKDPGLVEGAWDQLTD